MDWVLWLSDVVHREVDFCAKPLLVLLDEQCADQSQATLWVGKQTSDAGSAFDLFIQSLQPVGRSHAHPMRGGQSEDGKSLGKVLLGPQRKLWIVVAPELQRLL